MSARQKSSNYFRAFKRKFLREYGAVTLTMFYFHKIIQLIFQKQPSCPRNICTEH